MQYFGFDRPSFAFKTYGFGANFDPLDLFKDGKQGVWYDPSDKTTLFQDVAGTVPVTKDGDPVGLMLDKSQGLEGAITNVAKPFIADSSNSVIDVTNTSEGTKLVFRSLTNVSRIDIFEVNKTYKLSVVYSIPEPGIDISAYNTDSGANNLLFTATKGVRNKAEVTLTAKNTYLYFRTSSGEITIHEIVIKEIKEGNHASQPLAASRPTYRTDGILHWLVFDGADDSMKITLSKALSPSGELTVATGIKPTSTSTSMVIEQGVNTGSTNAFYLAVNSTGYEYLGRGNRAGGAGDMALVKTETRHAVLISEQAINSGVAASLSVNNLAPSLSSNTTFGGGGFGTLDIYIGSRAGSQVMYKGEIHGIVIVDSILSGGNKAMLKNYLATKSGVTL